MVHKILYEFNNKGASSRGMIHVFVTIKYFLIKVKSCITVRLGSLGHLQHLLQSYNLQNTN